MATKVSFSKKGFSSYRHSPTLDTVIMVEKAIKESDIPPTRTQLWNSLPRKVMYQTFRDILDYLDASGKVLFDKKDRIIWAAGESPKLQRFFDQAEFLK